MLVRSLVIVLAGMLVIVPAWAAGDATITPILQTSTTSAGVPLVYPKTNTPEIVAVKIEIPPGGNIGEHTHPVPTFIYVLKGAIDVPTKGGETRHYDAGQAYMEVVNMPHDGVNKGSIPAELLAVFVSEKGAKILQPVK